MRTLSEGDFKNKKTLVRVDFNVALGPKGEVVDDFRIVKTLPTIKFLAESGAIVVLMSHLETEDGPASLRPVSRRLAELLGRPVKFLSDCVGEKTREEISRAGAGEIILLENLRFHEGEKRNDAEFAAVMSVKHSDGKTVIFRDIKKSFVTRVSGHLVFSSLGIILYVMFFIQSEVF
ncbi:MAG: phosphoglycerate kinase [Bacteroidia bacterium]|nr:phosphoglycerate kinase [Bacteroidia bacterium]